MWSVSRQVPIRSESLQMAPKQTEPQYKLRMPQSVKDALEAAVAVSGRSLNAEIVFRLQWSIDEDEARERAARHYRMLERVADGTIDPEDVADGGNFDIAPIGDSPSSVLDQITTQLGELAKQQAKLSAQVSQIQAVLGKSSPGRAE